MNDVAHRGRWLILGIMVGLMTVGALVLYAAGPMARLIMDDLGIGAGAYGVISTAMSFAGVLTAFAAGRLVDRYGVKSVMFVTVLFMGLCLFLFFLPIRSFAVIYLFFFLVGCGYSPSVPLSSAAIFQWFPRNERAFALGFKQSGVPLGSALAGVLLPPLALAVGWKATLGLLGFLVVATAFACRLLYRDPPGAPGLRAGNGEQAPAAAAESPPPASPPADPPASSPVPSNPAPSFRRLLANPQMIWLCYLGLSFNLIQNSYIFFLSPFLQATVGVDIVRAGVLLGISQMAGVVARPIVGLISDRVFGGRRKETIYGTALMGGLSLALLAMLPANASDVILVPLILLSGLSTLVWIGPLFSAAMEQSADEPGAASGLVVTFVRLGGLAGPPVFGLLVDLTSYSTTMWLFAAWISLAGVLFLMFFRETRRVMRAQPA